MLQYYQKRKALKSVPGRLGLQVQSVTEVRALVKKGAIKRKK